MKVVVRVERGGKMRSFHLPNVKASTIKEILDANADKSANLMTDEASQYAKLGREYASHEVVKHNVREYARGNVHTNTIEGCFSILKRGLVGTFHHVGERHLQRYVNEVDFRYNHRVKLGFDDIQRTDEALEGISGKRLTYRRLNAQSDAQA